MLVFLNVGRFFCAQSCKFVQDKFDSSAMFLDVPTFWGAFMTVNIFCSRLGGSCWKFVLSLFLFNFFRIPLGLDNTQHSKIISSSFQGLWHASWTR